MLLLEINETRYNKIIKNIKYILQSSIKLSMGLISCSETINIGISINIHVLFHFIERLYIYICVVSKLIVVDTSSIVRSTPFAAPV
jgi:hypothetical protein